MGFDPTILVFGKNYNRPFLANLWGYRSFHPLSKGVVTPANSKLIILFVTKEKQGAFPQYNDYIDGNLLFWEGEEKHSSDKRIVDAAKNGDSIFLFYRHAHHSDFIYFGQVVLLEFSLKDNIPSEFIYRIVALPNDLDVFKEVREHSPEYQTMDVTEQEQIVVSRLGQGNFRKNVIRLWGSCSLTGLQEISLLRASHIKPWKDSNNDERLTPFNGLLLIPNYDFLFDKGLISFRDTGEILVSDRLKTFTRRVFAVSDDMRLRKSFGESKDFLEYHRDSVFHK